MENFEPKEHKSRFTEFHEQKAVEEREKIKKLNEKFKKVVKEFEEGQKKQDDLSV